jgi:hypothetical protein
MKQFLTFRNKLKFLEQNQDGGHELRAADKRKIYRGYYCTFQNCTMHYVTPIFSDEYWKLLQPWMNYIQQEYSSC